ncbi:hypothetical protein LMXM_17_1315 [Leishmania mexicana MHOM/GT/2001/U1103]|uniref:Uncharacterized protein n=1 Tax=Leishmania mexicana (strain MHOM/GT/2001/U1103) TaxID=929439 RepID=E9ARA4_LEIMU|nr:hypothetical protein LMXM_17_1315 [Leishmania mexicana MHOM/GT/2001/U1103]CBZ25491.1 hypothetical protein LMXM_17_1315 [Leishmania mexicana MHOM/GT/2001/U1103]
MKVLLPSLSTRSTPLTASAAALPFPPHYTHRQRGQMPPQCPRHARADTSSLACCLRIFFILAPCGFPFVHRRSTIASRSLCLYPLPLSQHVGSVCVSVCRKVSLSPPLPPLFFCHSSRTQVWHGISAFPLSLSEPIARPPSASPPLSFPPGQIEETCAAPLLRHRRGCIARAPSPFYTKRKYCGCPAWPCLLRLCCAPLPSPLLLCLPPPLPLLWSLAPPVRGAQLRVPATAHTLTPAHITATENSPVSPPALPALTVPIASTQQPSRPFAVDTLAQRAASRVHNERATCLCSSSLGSDFRWIPAPPLCLFSVLLLLTHLFFKRAGNNVVTPRSHRQARTRSSPEGRPNTGKAKRLTRNHAQAPLPPPTPPQQQQKSERETAAVTGPTRGGNERRHIPTPTPTFVSLLISHITYI